MKSLTRRDFLKFTGLTSAAALVLAACGSDTSSESGSTASGETASAASVNEGASGEAGGNNINETGILNKDEEAAKESYQLDVWRVHQGTELTTINPLTIKNASTGVWYSMYEMLFQNDDNMGGGMYAVLADDTKGSAGLGGYDHEEGSGDYTVYLREGITDAKGYAVTAEDVKFSFTKTYEAGETSGWDAALPECIEVVDDHTLIWHADRQLDKLGELENIWCRSFIFTQKAFEESASQFAADACGTGHYTLEDFTAGSQVVLVKNENYWCPADEQKQIQMANVDRIEYVQLTEKAQAVIALENGTLDYSQELKADNLGDFMEGGSYADKFGYYSYLANMCNALMLNCDDSAITSDKELRLAIYWAIDTEGLCKMMGATSYGSIPFIASSYFSDYNAEWETYDNYNTRCDLDEAKKHLEASSYDGRELRMLCASNSSTVSEIIQNMLGEIGINMSITSLDRATLSNDLADPTKWEMNINITAGDFMPTLWSHNHDFTNTASGDHSFNFVYDAKWQELLDECSTAEGHNDAKLSEYVQYTIDNAYGMGLFAQYNYCLYRNSLVSMCMNDKLYLVPGGCVYQEI